MKGYLRRRGENSYQLCVWIGKQRHWETVRGSKALAQRRLRELLTALDKNVYTPPSHMTVAELLEQWLTG